MSKKILTSIIFVLIFAFLMVTCPSKREHQEELKNTLSNVVDDYLLETVDKDSEEWLMLGSLLASEVISRYVDNKLKVDNYFIFSIGSVHYKGKTNKVSFGILNHVFSCGEDKIKEAISEFDFK